MSQTIEERIKALEKELALKNAYLSVKVSFPPSNKIPEEVKTQVIAEVRDLCTKLAEKQSVSVETASAAQFTAEEVAVLKVLIANVQNQLTNPGPSQPRIDTTSNPAIPGHNHVSKSQDVGFRKARLLSLENVSKALRNRMAPDEEVLVKSIKEDKACIVISNGQTGFVPLEDIVYSDEQ